MKNESKKKQARKRPVGTADAKREDFEPMTDAQLGQSLRKSIATTKGSR